MGSRGPLIAPVPVPVSEADDRLSAQDDNLIQAVVARDHAIGQRVSATGRLGRKVHP